MGYYVHFSITYSSDLNNLEKLTALVDKHKARLLTEKERLDKTDELSVPPEAIRLLEEILIPHNYNDGHKGCLFTWGIVGNYTDVECIVNWLAPFFAEQLRQELGPLDFDHIIIFQESEQSNQAQCWELYLDEDKQENKIDKLVIKHHQLPFCWYQM